MSVKKSITVNLTHVVLIVCTLIVLLPLYLALVAASHDKSAMLHAPIPFLPGRELWHNFYTVLTQGIQVTGGQSVAPMLVNSLWMALCIAGGKLFVSILSAYAIVYFRFPFKRFCFWMIFMTLMLPVEVRISPTYEVIASLHMVNNFSGLTLPLIASATATFLFRQFFMTIPGELVEAARLDGAGPFRFFVDILLPLSKTNIAALFIIMFIYGWNQYLWPLVATNHEKMATIVMGIQHLAGVADQIPQWHYVMTVAILAMLPPLLVVICMQGLLEKGLLEAEK